VKIGLERVPCFVRQAYEAVNLATDDQRSRERILRQVLFRLANVSFDKTPPFVGADIHRIVRILSGGSDPYLEMKKDSNTSAMKLMPALKDLIKTSANPFETAVKLAIAGNIIDCGQGDLISEERIKKTVSQCLDQPISKDAINDLKGEMVIFRRD
jgi:uncharacterized protein with ATP-grasp and redox domains